MFLFVPYTFHSFIVRLYITMLLNIKCMPNLWINIYVVFHWNSFIETLIIVEFSYLYRTQGAKCLPSHCFPQFPQAPISCLHTFPIYINTVKKKPVYKSVKILWYYSTNEFTLFIFPLSTNFKPFRGSSADVDVLSWEDNHQIFHIWATDPTRHNVKLLRQS